MANVIYTRLGERRGNRRLWLEGTRLANQGIVPGIRFDLRMEKGRAVLQFGEQGERVVSRRQRNGKELPVIDVNSAELEQALGQAERIRVVIRRDCIEVTVHHHEMAERDRVQRLLAKLADGRPLDIGSLAHGGGILDHAIHTGLRDAGIPSRLAFAVEIEKAYLDCSQQNNEVWDAESVGIEAPMEEVEVRKLPKCDVLLSGLPCTGASLSGRAKNGLKRAEEHETAGALYLAFLNVVQATRPSVVLLENVPAYQGTVSYLVINQVLEGLGYTVHDTILDGHALGALERRQRLCMVAVSRDVKGFDFDGLKPVRTREESISAILDDVPEDSERWRAFEYLDAKQERDKEAGKGFSRQVLSGDEEGCGTIGRGYAKCRSTEPFLLKPDGSGLQRIFTPREHARLKGIPEHLIDGVSDTIAHEILGQSVIHPAFKAVGRLLGATLASLKAPRMLA